MSRVGKSQDTIQRSLKPPPPHTHTLTEAIPELHVFISAQVFKVIVFSQRNNILKTMKSFGNVRNGLCWFDPDSVIKTIPLLLFPGLFAIL